MNNKIQYSFIIISRENEDYKNSLDSIFNQKNISNNEIIICQGQNPSYQRNKAAEIANGENLIFLDNDSLLSSNFLERLGNDLNKFEDLVAIGGISEIHSNGSLFQDSIKLIFSTPIAIGPFNKRYNSYGEIRRSSQKELIMCNLIIRKNIYLNQGGLNETLYPNEENELLDRISKIGPIYHDPLLVVSRPPRSNFSKFIFQMFSYGKGRGRQLMLKKEINQLIYFLPMFFFLYVAIEINHNKNNLCWIAIVTYLVAVFIGSLYLCMKNKKKQLFPFILINIISCHFFYGIGQLIGILTYFRLQKTDKKIFLKTIKI